MRDRTRYFFRAGALRVAALLLALSAFAPYALGQFTTVSGTVTDPNGIPYAGGTISATLTTPGTPKFTASNTPYVPPSQPSGLSSAGSFVMQLADVTALTPGGGTWGFTVCSAAATVQPSVGKGSVCFSVTGITISGASQSITSTLTAAALALTVPIGAGGAVTSVFGRTGAVVAAATDYKGVPSLSLGDSVSDILFGSSAVTIGDRTPPGTGDNILLGPYGTGGSSNGIQMTGANGTSVLIDNAPGADDFSVTGSGTFGHIAFVEGANDSQQTTTGWYSSHVMSSPHHAVGPICQAAGTAANPSVVACGANSGGAFSCATNASGGTCVVNTTAVCVPTPISGTCDATNALTFASPIFVSQVTDEGAALGVTCNTNPVTALVSARVNATSFTVTLGSFTTNPVCFDFVIQ